MALGLPFPVMAEEETRNAEVKSRMSDTGSESSGSRQLDSESMAAEVFSLLGRGRQVQPFSARRPDFDVQEAYRVSAQLRALREERGEQALGRKIGFTNRTIWSEYGISQPIWGYVYDTTVSDLVEGETAFSLSGLAEPRLEPEIVFGLASAPRPGMDEAGLLACIDWVAHGFEIVHSIFPGWRFAVADTIAAGGLHGALLIGPRHSVGRDAAVWLPALSRFTIQLSRDGEPADRGEAANVLGGPLSALRHLVELLAFDSANPPLAAGEIVTTGTLTRAFPVSPGELWQSALDGIPLEGAQLRFT